MNNPSRAHKYRVLISNSLIFALGAIGSKLILFLLLPLYTNTLSSAEYGIADLVFTTSEILRPFVSLAIFNGLLRFGLAANYRKEDVLRCTAIVFCVGSAVSFLVAPVFQVYAAVAPWKWYLAAYTIAVFASKNVLIYLKISDQNKLYSALSVFQAFSLAVSNILMLLVFKRGIEGYLMANIFAHLSVSCGGFFLGRLPKALRDSRFNGQLMKELILYSVPFIANDIAWWLIHSTDKVMLELMVSASVLGIYSVASKMPLLLNVVSSVFDQAWMLSVVKEFEGDNDNAYYNTVLRYFVTFLCGISIVLSAVARPFLYVYVGEEFRSAWQFVPLLLVSAGFSSLTSFLSSFLAAVKNSKAIMWSTLLSAVTNLAVNALLIPYIGVWGAIVGTVLSYLVLLVVRVSKLPKDLLRNMPMGFLLRAFFVVLAHALLISWGANILLCSCIALMLYFTITHNECRQILRFGFSFLKTVCKRGRA